MEKRLFNLTNLILLNLLLSFSLMAQDVPGIIQVGKSVIITNGQIFPYPFIGRNTTLADTLSYSLKLADVRKTDLLKKGSWKITIDHPKFSLPVKVKDGFTDPGFYTITAYTDHDTLYPDFLLDYNCGSLTYDLGSGYNHEGTDFLLWPYPWHKMTEDAVEVVAAAPGTLIIKQDGNYDLNCEENTEPWNGIGLLHEDGSTTWYIHLKKNSLTSKPVGETVEQGEYLGIVGSSGSSLMPHLHFEVRDAGGDVIDPFAGLCNASVSESWWLNQLPYKEPAVNKVSTHSHLPVYPECPQQEILNESTVFYPGDSIFLLAYFRNISAGDQVQVKIFTPDNTVFAEWLWTNPNDFYTASYVFFLMFLNEEHFGTWKYEVSFYGMTYEAYFELKDPQGLPNATYTSKVDIFPNPAENMIWIKFPPEIQQKIGIKLYNSTGQKIEKFPGIISAGSACALDITDLPLGIYVIQLNLGSEPVHGKFIKK
jgi:hypothetical protein